jgi:Xaa-Pro aminopeptidase
VDEHAASPHYQATEITGTKLINQDSIYLVDSGGQYRDGTTDVTRTVCFNSNPDEYTKKMFTLVLIGHINLARTSFPEGISGIKH